MLLRVIGGAAFPLAKREKMLFQELGRASAGIVRISLYLQSAACIGGGRIKLRRIFTACFAAARAPV